MSLYEFAYINAGFKQYKFIPLYIINGIKIIYFPEKADFKNAVGFTANLTYEITQII